MNGTHAAPDRPVPSKPIMPKPEMADRLRHLARHVRKAGLSWVFVALADRIAPDRPAFAGDIIDNIRDKRGLEVGGPSRIFRARGAIPIYPNARVIDNVNFALETEWEHGLKDRGPFTFHPSKQPGMQWIGEASRLNRMEDGAYDFVITSHCLEHLANPLAALHEWRRVTRPGGHLILIVPDPSRSFDHRRPITTCDHLLADFRQSTSEDDQTHFQEVLALHDISRDPGIDSAAELRARIQNNVSNRCVHHHVFDTPLLEWMLRTSGWTVQATTRLKPVHLVAFARNPRV